MKRIAYCIEGLYNAAGMERVLTKKANALCHDYAITIIIRQQHGRPNAFPLDTAVRTIDLDSDIPHYEERLREVLMREHFDIVTTMGGYEMYFLYRIKDGSRKVFEFHFSFDISKVWLAGIRNPLKRWLWVRLQTWRRILIARHYDRLVVLCKADERKWRRYTHKVETIYNPLMIHPVKTAAYHNHVAIAVGRLDYQKGFDYLIDAWKIIADKHPDWRLNIYGEGKLRDSLQKQIDQNRLQEKVSLCGRTNCITEKYLESSIFILSSRDEAFGLVITEAEACGLPVVTFACPNAPAELVDDGRNGYVVPKVGDVRTMAVRIEELIEDENLRKAMGKASVAFAERFREDKIWKEWRELYSNFL